MKITFILLIFLCISDMVFSQETHPAENYEIKRDTVLANNLSLTWFERTIPGSFLEIEYDYGSEKYRDLELVFYINMDSVTSIRKESFRNNLDWDYLSVFKLSSIYSIEYDKATDTIFIGTMIGKPDTDYLIFVDLYLKSDLSFKYELRNPELSEEW